MLLLLTAGSLSVWLRACSKVAVVYVLKVFGHRVLVVTVNSTFLLRAVGVIPILQERDKGSIEKTVGSGGNKQGEQDQN